MVASIIYGEGGIPVKDVTLQVAKHVIYQIPKRSLKQFKKCSAGEVNKHD